jgi:3-phosphoinositide dependent protein kinase-1
MMPAGSAVETPVLRVATATNSTTASAYPSSTNANILAALSRNTSVISSSSSSSSTSSLVPPVQQTRAFSNETATPTSPTTPRSHRFPNTARHVRNPSGEVAQSSPSQPEQPGSRRPSASKQATRGTRSPQRGAAPTPKALTPDDFELGHMLGEGSYSTVRYPSVSTWTPT